jgi:hypothetical protein
MEFEFGTTIWKFSTANNLKLHPSHINMRFPDRTKGLLAIKTVLAFAGLVWAAVETKGSGGPFITGAVAVSLLQNSGNN